MAEDSLKPIRRVVTGNDQLGRSRVIWDGPAPNTHKGESHMNGWTDFLVWYESPLPLSGDHDDGNLPYDFPGPANGGHLRAVQGKGCPPGYDPSKDPAVVPPHAPKERPAGRTWDRGGRNIYTSDMHKTETVDYAILIQGERRLILDDGEVNWRIGDVVIQVGAYHQWSSPGQGGIVVYDMMAARFVDGPVGLAQGNDTVMRMKKQPGGGEAGKKDSNDRPGTGQVKPG